FYRARWYDPRAGRFLSEDPLGFAAGDVNLSRYVGNGATLWVDPSGMDAQRVGHHYVPQSVLRTLMKEALLDKDSVGVLDTLTEIPRHMKHGYDSWFVDGQKITHAAYNKAMEELMRGIAQQGPTGKIDKAMVEQLIKAFETGDFSKYSFATDQLNVIQKWCRGFLKAQGLSHALSQLIDKLKLEQLSEKEMKAAVRYLMGDRSVVLNAKAKKIIKAMEDGGTAQLFSRMAANSDHFKRAGKFLGFVSWAFFARDAMAGAVGDGHRADLKGLSGAIDNAAYEAMMAGEIEDCFRSMANSASTASGGLQGLGPIDRKRIRMDLPALGSERVPQKSNR
ncbi:MAG: RHS repeat domain-containing protein, partial [Planctomycetaceae bacterium]